MSQTKKTKTKGDTAKSKRVAFDVPAEVKPDVADIIKLTGLKNAGIAKLAFKFAVTGLKSGKLVKLNDEFVPAENGVPLKAA